MSVDGRRFGIGLAAGLLFALAVVAAYGALPATGGAAPQGSVASATSTATANSASTGPNYVAVSTTPSASTAGNQSASTAAGGQSQGKTQAHLAFSSDLSSATRLSSSSRALLVAPIVVGALLGVLLFRASGRGQRDGGRPDS